MTNEQRNKRLAEIKEIAKANLLKEQEDLAKGVTNLEDIKAAARTMGPKMQSAFSIAPEFIELFEFKSYEDEIEHMAKMIGFRILSEVEKVCEERNISHKHLAELVGVTPSYISQVFSGDKFLNMLLAAKFEKALDITFKITI